MIGSFGNDTLYGETGVDTLQGSFGDNTEYQDGTELSPSSAYQIALSGWDPFWDSNMRSHDDHDEERRDAIAVDASYAELVDRLFTS